MRTVAVIGATGAQGGGVARRLQKTGEWQVRGITRNLSSKSAQNLKAEGMDVAPADLDDHASLMKAFEVSLPISRSQASKPQTLPQPVQDDDEPQPRDPCC